MRLVFADETELDVIRIYGASRVYQGAMRDELAIEIDPDAAAYDELIKIFEDTDKTAALSTISDEGERSLIGADYSLLTSISQERRDVPRPPGEIAEPISESVIVVRVAQLSYVEKHMQELEKRIEGLGSSGGGIESTVELINAILGE